MILSACTCPKPYKGVIKVKACGILELPENPAGKGRKAVEASYEQCVRTINKHNSGVNP